MCLNFGIKPGTESQLICTMTSFQILLPTTGDLFSCASVVAEREKLPGRHMGTFVFPAAYEYFPCLQHWKLVTKYDTHYNEIFQFSFSRENV